MAALFGSLANDIFIAFIFGVIGGLAAELIDSKGNIEIPHKAPGHWIDVGFLAKMIVGGIAAWALFYILDTNDPFKFVGASVAAGFGGSATLIAIKEKILGQIKQREAEAQTKNAEEASEKIEEVVDKLKELKMNLATGRRGISSSDIDTLIIDARAQALSIKRSSEKAREVLKELK